jgi:16S rRNA (guanine527-N7)-methyltransferase
VKPEERNMLCNAAREIGIELTGGEIDQFELFTGELLRWNSKLNLTSLKNLTDIITKHYLDSLTICDLIPIGASLLDIGSGGGFPCIPLKIVRPDIDILSVDSVQKKINFQRQAARLLGFEKFKAVHARAEDLAGEYGEQFDFVVARAVAEIAVLARMSKPFLSVDGKIIAMKGSRWKEELEESESELSGVGLCVFETRELKLPIIGDLRGLILLSHLKRSNAHEGPKTGR